MRMFPALKRVWQDVAYEEHESAVWKKQRRACSPEHFDTYFRFSLSENAVSIAEIRTLVAGAGDSECIRRLFLEAAEFKMADGGTKPQVFLQELAIRVDEVSRDHIGNLLKSIYSVADSLVLAEGREGTGLSIFGETLHQVLELTCRLTMERLAPESRSSVIRGACNDAATTSLAFIAGRVHGEWQRQENEIPVPALERLTTERHVEELRDLSLKRIREAADNGSLINCPLLMVLLLCWNNAENGDEAVRSWVNTVIHDNEVAVVRIAEAFTGAGSSRCIEDSVPERSHAALTDKLKLIADLQAFKARAKQVLVEGNLEVADLEKLKQFLDAWRRQERTF